ncbi:protein O-linked-mannose beta-1,2-N-acetylglucosaminyltransferase 1-like [Diadema antillarum]|uniref:protein O-linked-mannose beta-1,2-N-acetylglucosaminyltransferase 1-like n=1 Tax=Diadema antillarum TaxID=105358 RepID=UPI003A8748DB
MRELSMRFCRRFRRTSLPFQIAVIGLLALIIVVLSTHLRSDSMEEALLLQNLKKELHRDAAELSQGDCKEFPVEGKAMCGNYDPCPAGQFAYRVKSGFQNKHRPEMCLEGDENIFPQIEMGRGLNVLQIEAKTRRVTTKRSFDTYAHDSEDLVAFLNSVSAGDILLIVTFDDATNRLSPQAVKMFEDIYGSRQAHLLSYRSMWAFIGQKYTQHDGSHEMMTQMKKPESEWGVQTEIKGCFSIPLGENREPSIFEDKPQQNLCMVSRVCESNEVAVHVESGRTSQGMKIYPKVCFEGKTVLSNYWIDEVKPAKRGLNFLVMNPNTGQVVSSGNFDTYSSDTQDLACADFLRSVSSGMMVIGSTFDEASRKLGQNTRRELQKLGSSMIQDLDYREMWAFVGQKGIQGLTPYEKVSEDVIDGWGTKAEIWDCIPKYINGSSVRGAVIGLKKKTEFCQKYLHSFRDMCSPVNVHRPIIPLDLDDESLRANPAYATPIIVVPGSDLEALQRTLESLVAIPGLNPQMVVVILEGNFAQPNELVAVYGFRAHYIKAKSQYLYALQSGIEEGMALFPKSEFFIIIEEYVEVAPDFLRYFSQTMHLLEQDDTLMTISAWNEHGFKHTSGDVDLLYRVDIFPGYGWIMRRSIWKSQVQKNELKCCADQTWREWLRDDYRKGRESIVPDVSRVKRAIKPGIYEDRPFMEEYLSNRTITR